MTKIQTKFTDPLKYFRELGSGYPPSSPVLLLIQAELLSSEPEPIAAPDPLVPSGYSPIGYC